MRGFGTALEVCQILFWYMKMKIDVVQLELKKSHTIEFDIENRHIYIASQAAPIFCKEIGGLNTEHVGMLSLDHYNRVLNYFTVSMGTTENVKVSLAQMFRNALLSNAGKIMIAHNHPSGILEITSHDIEMTKKIAFLAGCFEIELVDSLVVTANDFISIRQNCKDLKNE